MNMNRSSFERSPSGNCSGTNRDRITLDVLIEVGRDTMARDDFIRLAFWTTDDCGVGLTQAMRRFDQGIEHSLQVEGRTADDLEHVGGGGLLLEGFPQLVEQARVLDGDNRLGGEILYQRDLFFSEGPYLLAVDGDGPHQLIIFEHRHNTMRAR